MIAEARSSQGGTPEAIDRGMPNTTTTPVHLSAEQIATLRSALDSWLYEEAPEEYRSSGNVLDPRMMPERERDGLTDDDAAVCDLIDEHDAIERILMEAQSVAS